MKKIIVILILSSLIISIGCVKEEDREEEKACKSYDIVFREGTEGYLLVDGVFKGVIGSDMEQRQTRRFPFDPIDKQAIICESLTEDFKCVGQLHKFDIPCSTYSNDKFFENSKLSIQ